MMLWWFKNGAVAHPTYSFYNLTRFIMTNPQQLVQKLWNYCNILRDDGLSYGDYVEQRRFLLFLKMADEQRNIF